MPISRDRWMAAALAAILALILLIGSLASLAVAPAPAVAGPPAVQVVDDPVLISVNSAAIAADTNFSGHIWGRYENADLAYDIDQTNVNTLSLELEVSLDGVTWFDHTISPTLLSANEADAAGYVAGLPVHGWQWRIVANVTNSETVTPVVKVLLR